MPSEKASLSSFQGYAIYSIGEPPDCVQEFGTSWDPSFSKAVQLRSSMRWLCEIPAPHSLLVYRTGSSQRSSLNLDDPIESCQHTWRVYMKNTTMTCQERKTTIRNHQEWNIKPICYRSTALRKAEQRGRKNTKFGVKKHGFESQLL